MSARGRWVPERWQQRWLDLSGRERTGLSLALGLLALALVWSVGVEPAWRQWQQGQARTLALQTQWQGIQALQTQASALNAQSRVRPDEAVRLLQTSVANLGPGASLVVNGDLATVQIKAATAAAPTISNGKCTPRYIRAQATPKASAKKPAPQAFCLAASNETASAKIKVPWSLGKDASVAWAISWCPRPISNGRG